MAFGTYQPIFLHVGLLVGYWQGPTKIEVASVLNFRKFSSFFLNIKEKESPMNGTKKKCLTYVQFALDEAARCLE